MTEAEQLSASDAVRNIDLGFMKFIVSRDGKMIFIPKKPGAPHITIHPGGCSGIIDIHETTQEPDGRVRHKTIFAMRQQDLGKLFQDLAHLDGLIKHSMRALLRPARPGWLWHRGIMLLPGLSESDYPAVMERRGKRLAFSEEKYVAKLSSVPQDLWDYPDGSFFYMSVRRMKREKMIGILIKASVPGGGSRLFWMKSADLAQFFERLKTVFVATATKYALPSSEYPGRGEDHGAPPG